MKAKLFMIFILIIGLFGCTPLNSNTTDNLLVHFIDVGQGDAILIQGPNNTILIDSGPSDEKEKLFKYLKSASIDKIDFIIATHPHEDHIGNMADVIHNYDIKEFYAPKVIHSSSSFEKMVEALMLKDKKINVLSSTSNNPLLMDDMLLEVFSPNKETYDNLNNYSPIIKLTYGDTSFLFTGDAEKEVEEYLVNNKADIKSDVIKIGHHGSTTSTSKSFLEAVSPSFAVISVGLNNSYGHPKSTTLKLLTENNIDILRTDELGSIVIASDGKKVFQYN